MGSMNLRTSWSQKYGGWQPLRRRRVVVAHPGRWGKEGREGASHGDRLGKASSDERNAGQGQQEGGFLRPVCARTLKQRDRPPLPPVPDRKPAKKVERVGMRGV